MNKSGLLKIGRYVIGFLAFPLCVYFSYSGYAAWVANVGTGLDTISLELRRDYYTGLPFVFRSVPTKWDFGLRHDGSDSYAITAPWGALTVPPLSPRVHSYTLFGQLDLASLKHIRIKVCGREHLVGNGLFSLELPTSCFKRKQQIFFELSPLPIAKKDFQDEDFGSLKDVAIVGEPVMLRWNDNFQRVFYQDMQASTMDVHHLVSIGSDHYKILLKALLKTRGRTADLRYYTAYLLQRDGDDTRALEHYIQAENAEEWKPERYWRLFWILRNRAFLYEQMGRHGEALKDLQKISDLEIDDEATKALREKILNLQ